MNKKGFTIVELLAVMAILSLLIVIIVSGTSGTKTRAVEKAQAIEKKKIIDAAISYYESKSDSYGKTFSSDNFSCKVNIGKLRSSKIYDTDKFVNTDINDNTLIKVENNNGNVSASILTSDDSSIFNCDVMQAGLFLDNLIKSQNPNPNDPEVVIEMDAPEGETCTYTFAYDGIEENNLRYVGANPCNYVSFNDEIWRILGKMNNIDNGKGNIETRIKIIRKDPIGRYSWDSSEPAVNYGNGSNDWTKAKLREELNKDYLKTTLTTNPMWYNGKDNQRTAVFDRKFVLKKKSQDLIEDAVWNLGAVDYTGGVDRLRIPKTMYIAERTLDASNSRPQTWIGKVALITPSDFTYATSGGSTTSRKNCLETLSASYGSDWGSNTNHKDCKDNDYLVPTGYSWTLTPPTGTGPYSIPYTSSGMVSYSSSSMDFEVRPAVYLKSEVKILDGDGSLSHPYIIG